MSDTETTTRAPDARSSEPARLRWVERWCWPLPLVGCVAVFVAVLLAWTVTLIAGMTWAPPTWLRLDRLVRDSTWVPALVAALGAGCFGRWISTSSVAFPAAAGRGRESITWRFVAVLSVATAAAAVLAVAVFAVLYPWRGAFLGPTVLGVLSHLCGIVAAVPLGLLLARVAPRRLWPVVTLLGTAVVLFLPLLLTDGLLRGTGYSAYSISPVWGIVAPEDGWLVPWSIALLRIGYFGALFVACTFAAGAPGRRGDRRERAATLGTLAVPVALVVAVTTLSPRLPLVVPGPIEYECEEVGEVTVCLPHDDRSLIPELADIAGTLAAVVPDADLVVTSEGDTTGARRRSLAVIHDVDWIASEPDYWHEAARAIGVALLDPEDCEVVESGPVPREYWRGVLSRMLVMVDLPPEKVGNDEATGEPVYPNGYEELLDSRRRRAAGMAR